MDGPLDAMAWFYNQRGGAENLIKEANHDAGLAARIWAMNAIHFQLAILAYNRNCCLLLFQRQAEEFVTRFAITKVAFSRREHWRAYPLLDEVTRTDAGSG